MPIEKLNRQRISDQQISFSIKNESERTPVCVGKNARLRAVRLELNDAPVFEPAVNSSVRIDRNIFRRVALAETQSLHRREPRVLLVWTSQSRSDGRRPGGRRDRHRRKEQIDERRSNEGDNEG